MKNDARNEMKKTKQTWDEVIIKPDTKSTEVSFEATENGSMVEKSGFELENVPDVEEVS